VEFWDKGAYYNMCMPQRPDVFWWTVIWTFHHMFLLA